MILRFTAIAALVLCWFHGLSQPGKNGAFTVTGANTVVNNYSAITANVAAGSSTVTVNNVATELGGIAAGDLIMMYQAQGASIQTTDDNNYGAILNYNNAGRYEFAYVASVASNTITVGCTFKQSYTATGRAQVVKVPLYTNLTINAGASIVPLKWTGARGGIVIVHVSGTLTNNGTLSAESSGFRGGKRDNLTSNADGNVISLYRSPNSNTGAEKGEGIAGYQADYDAAGMGGRYGRGAPANGGGGGNGHNAAGGGGANGDNGRAWTGAGVMDPNPLYLPAWALDPDFISNGNALTNSSGGGRGGYTYAASNANAFVNPPGDAAWGGDQRDAVGGRGGRPLASIVENRIFFGGGGGAGDGNNNASNDGGDGGGIVYVIANTIAGTGSITAAGQAGFNTTPGHNDAPGGGGGGGAIVIKAYRFTGQALNASGGAGGNQLIVVDESEGCAGGGGGGFIAVPTSGVGSCGVTNSYSYVNGTNGTSTSASSTEFPPNGGTLGATGQNDIPVSPYFMPYTLTCLIDEDGDGGADGIADLDEDNDGIADLNESFGGINPSADADGDNIPNYIDPSFTPYSDTNCDGVNDYFDFDLDGVVDFLDLDSDNDGITDCLEAGGNDANKDGIVDGFVDADGNGMSDALGAGLVPADLDGDSRMSFRDRDSDGDGITDCIEAGGTDANGDGIIDGFADSDNDGYATTVDPTTNNRALGGANASGNAPLSVPDTDGDSKRNFLDIDSDNDGITDNVEAQSTAAYIVPVNSDTDGDGIANVYDTTPLVIVNTDAADVPDYLDTDSDNDNVPDNIEGNDANSDGIPVPALPVTGDADGDGLLDGYDLLNSANVTVAGMGGTGSNAPLQDTDGDALRDWRDNDDDGDCTLTSTTGALGENTDGNASWADDFSQSGTAKPNYLYATNQVAVTNGTRCGTGSVSLSAAGSSSGTFRWYTALTGGSLLQTTTAASTSTYNTPSIAANTTYYVEFENGVCVTAPRKAVVASIISAATTPTVTAASRCGAGTVILQAAYGSAGIFRWYNAASGGTLLQTTPAATTSSYTTPVIGVTTNYYVEFDNGTCTSGRALVAATISSLPTVTVTDGSTCGAPTATLSASTGSLGTFNWYDAASGGLLLYAQPGVTASAYTTPTISANTTYYVEFTNGVCTSARTAVNATITSAITAPTVTNTTICSAAATSVSASYGSAGTFRWYAAATGGAALQTNTGVTTSTYSIASPSSSTTYYVEYSNGSCTSARTPATVYVVSNILTTIDASRCGDGSITVGASSPISGTFNWYNSASSGSSQFSNTGTVSSFTTTINSTEDYFVTFTTTSPACTTPRIQVNAVRGTSNAVTATNGISCSPGTVTLSASTGVSGTFRWYATSAGGTALATSTSVTTSSYTTTFLNGTTDYYVEFDNGTCISSPRTVVRASIVNDLTTTDASRCGTGSVDLLVSSLTSGTFTWWDAATAGTSLRTSTGLTDTYNTGNISATKTYYVSITTGTPACTSPRFPAVATIYPTPAAPTNINGSRCGTGTVTLAASSPTTGTIRWYNSSSGGTLLQTDNTTTLSTYVTPSITSTTNYWVEFDNGGCTSSRMQVTATVNTGTAPAAPTVTAASLCGPGSVALGASSASSGTFRWYTALTGGTLLQTTTGASSSTFNTPSLSLSTTYYVEFDNGTCLSSARAVVTATINTVPTQPTAASVSRCGNGIVTLTATSATSGTFNWYAGPSGGSSLLTTTASTTSSYTTTALAATTTYYVEFSNGSCTSSPRVAVSAVINTLPTAPSGIDGSSCGTGTVVLSANASSTGTFRWYDAATGGNLLATNPSTASSSFTTPTILANTNYYVEFDNGVCTSTRTLVVASVLTRPATPAVTNGSVCGSGTVALSTTSATSGTFRWYTLASGGTLLKTDAASTSSSYTTPSLASTTTYYVEFDNATCASLRAAVTATVNPNPVISSVTAGCTGIAGNGTLAITASIAAGVLEYSINGTAYQPSPNFTGLANNTYTVYVRSTVALCVVSQTGIVVKCNVPPTVSDKTATTNEDIPLSGDVTDAGDLDADGTTLTVNTTPVVGPVNGSITLNTNGTYTYTPNAGFSGTETITFQVCDNGTPLPAACVDRTLTVTINSVNDEPTFVKGANQTVNEDATAQTVIGWATSINKGDPSESAQILAFAVTNNNNGLFSVQPSISATGELTYSLTANANGVATVSVVLSDNGGTANGGDDTFTTQTFTITVNAVNDEPSFVKGADQVINEDAGAQSVVGWATALSKGPANESAQALTFVVTNDNNGLFAVQPAINATTGNLTYTLAANANGVATVSVVLSDNGGTANGGDDTFTTQTFTITVNAVNDEPTFVKGLDQTVNEDAGAQTVIGWATSLSKGAANESAQVLSFNTTNNNNALFSVQPSINVATGTLTYTPAAGVSGVATVTVVLSDDGGTANGGDDSSTQTFTITINSVNDEPNFVKGANQTVNEDAAAQTVTGWATSISKGDAGESAQVLNFAVTNDNNGLFSVQPAINATTGNLTYTLAANANGIANVSVVLSDNGGTANGGDDTFATQTFTITVNAVNDEPTFVKGLDQTINEDAGAQTLVGWATAISKGPANESVQSLTFTLTNNNNTLFSTQPTINPATGTLTYTPAAGASGVATVTVVLSDDGGTSNGGDDSSTQTFTITINSVNDEPSFVKGANQTVNEDAAAQTVTGWATSISKGDAGESAQILTFAVTNDNNGLFSAQPAIDATTGNLTYTLAANANGIANVSVILSDNGGTINGGDDTFATQTFTITVNAVNDEPTFVKGLDQTINEDAGAQTVAAWATALNKGAANESAQVLNFALTNDNNTLFSTQPTINPATGTLSYTPAAGTSGVATVTVVLSDNGGTTNGGDNSSTQTFTITINSVNDEPSFAKGANQTVNEDAAAQTVLAWATSINKGDPTESAQALTFAVTNDNNTLFTVQPAINATNGNLTYTPAANAFGVATVTVILTDNGGTANGGDDTFTTQTFTITVNAVNDEPTFVKGLDQTINEDAGAQTVVSWASALNKGAANESAQVLSFNTTNNNNTLFSVQPIINVATGTLTYTPAAGVSGVATVTVVLSDDGGTTNGGDDSSTQTFTITINNVNDEPGFVKGANQTVNEDASAQTVTGWATSISKGDAGESAQVLTFTVTSDNNGLFLVQPGINAVTGNLTYTLAANANGIANVSVVLSDNGGTANGGDDTFATQTFTITVNAVNDEPTFVKGLDQALDENAGAQSVVGWATALNKGAANESSQVLSFTLTNDNNALFSAQPAINPATGTLTYTPAAGASGTAIVTVVLSDDGGTANGGDDSSTQTFIISINSVNDEPSFVKGANQTVNEDATAQTITGWATSINKGDAGESAQTLTFTVTNNNSGLFSVQPAISAAGDLTYTLAANANGVATVSVVLSDNGGTANGGDDTFTTQTFTITVNAVNDEPTFVKGLDQTINDDAGTQTLVGWATAISKGAANESAQVLSFTLTNNNNSLFSVQPTINPATGTLTYTPAAGASGVASVTVVLNDDGGTANGGDDSSTQTFTITINNVNDEPSFVKGANQIVNEDAAAQTVTGWATSINKGDASENAQILTFTVTNDNNGLFSVQPAINATTGNLTYTLAANANGITNVSVVLSDNGGTANGGDDTFATQTFTITVNAVNDEPTFVKGLDQTINEDAGAQTLVGWATAISKGPANESAQSLTFTLTNNNNTLFSTQPTINPATGTLTYTPAAGASGVATVTVVLSDDGGTSNGGDDSSTQTFTITINNVNDEPSFVKGANQIVNEDVAAQTVTGWATSINKGDASENAQILTFTVTNDNNGLFSAQPAIDATTGNLTYTLAANANGIANVSVILSDNGGTINGGDDTFATQTFTITVNAVNDEPTFVKGLDQTINEDAGAQSVAAWATALNKGAANESVQVLSFNTTNDNNALFSVQPTINVATGTLTYTPAPGMSGVAVVTVVLNDNGGTANGGDNTSTQSFTITINNVNDEPSFVKGGNQTVNEDAAAQTIAGWATSISKGDATESAQALTFTVTNNNNTLFSVQPAISATGELTYTLAADANGIATVSVVLSDNGGTANGGDDTFTTQTFTITVNAVNDEPSFVKGADQMLDEDAGAQTINSWATAISAGPANESAQTLSLVMTNNNNAMFVGQPALDASGNLTYTTAPNAYGVAVVTVTITDNGGTANGGDNSSTQTFTITVNSVNDLPVAVSDAPSTNEDNAVTYDIIANDTDTDGTIDAATVDLNPSTPAIDASITTAEGTWKVDAAGKITFTPVLNYFGPAAVTYTVRDSGGATSAPGTISISVKPVNDPVAIGSDNQVTNEDTALTFNVTNNDTDVDGTVAPATLDLDPLTPGIQHNIVNAGGNWSVDNAGNVTFTPAPNYSGTATIPYTVNDDAGAVSLPGNITVTVNPVNDKPIAVADIVNTGEDLGVSFNPTTNDSDADGTVVASTLDLDPSTAGIQRTVTTSQGLWTADNSGNVTFLPKPDYNGSATVSYTIADNAGATSNAVVISVSVSAVNDEPVLVDKAFIVTQGRGATDNLMTGAFDPDGTLLNVNTTPLSGPSHGTITVRADGTYFYMAGATYTGTDKVVIEVCDSGLPLPGLCSQVTLDITIVVNQTPVVSAKPITTAEDTKLNGSVLASTDSDPEGLPLKVSTTPLNGPSHGTIVIQPDGKFEYTPNVNYHGQDTVKVSVCDSAPVPACANTEIIFTITPVNDAPVLTDDVVSADRNGETNGVILSGDYDPDSTKLVVNTSPVTSPAHGTFVIDNAGNFTYTPDKNFTGEDKVVIEVCDSGDPLPGLCVTTTLTILVTDPVAGVIYVPEGFSPNGDQVNDSFVITYTGPDRVQLEVFNRWGNIVYSNESYQNDWQGISTHGVTVGKDLPDGTYFYKVVIGEFQQVKSFTLKR